MYMILQYVRQTPSILKGKGDRLFEKQFGNYAQGKRNQSGRIGLGYGSVASNYNFFGKREI